ncbi:MAG: N-acetylmuramoyl-L-alanine amidase [Bacteroidales bacterium]|nr:N-acetylmuramoyl-L-alanine amidase [Bacteroidales bacterium]
MRKIDKIILHCSATAEGRNFTVQQIRDWHVKGNGWRDIGYHYVIYLDGSVHRGRPENQVGAHCTGHNANSIGVCYIGGCAADGKTPKDTRTPAQRAALISLVKELRSKYPGATVHGHNEFANKACPSFNVQKEPELCGHK